MSGSLLGQRESDRLEFKCREALDHADTIGREVVGMLNARGGDIWIGVHEENGYANQIEHIGNASARAAALYDSLIDTIEPALTSRELRVETQVLGEGLEVIRVLVEEGARKPYAYLRLKDGKWRLYSVRIHGRLRPMTYNELRSSLATPMPRQPDPADEGREEAAKRLSEAVERAGGQGLFVSVRPLGGRPLDLRGPLRQVESWLRDPTTGGNRPMGWNVTPDAQFWAFAKREDEPHFDAKTAAIELGKPGAYRWARITASALVAAGMPVERLHWIGPERTIWPYALLEYPASVIRFARHMYGELRLELAADTKVIAALALAGIRGWSLYPGSPGSIGYELAKPSTYEHDADDPLFVEPVEVTWRELQEEPDRTAFRLVRQVYEAFGWSEDKIPPEFRRRPYRLEIPT